MLSNHHYILQYSGHLGCGKLFLQLEFLALVKDIFVFSMLPVARSMVDSTVHGVSTPLRWQLLWIVPFFRDFPLLPGICRRAYSRCSSLSNFTEGLPYFSVFYIASATKPRVYSPLDFLSSINDPKWPSSPSKGHYCMFKDKYVPTHR